MKVGILYNYKMGYFWVSDGSLEERIRFQRRILTERQKEGPRVIFHRKVLGWGWSTLMGKYSDRVS